MDVETVTVIRPPGRNTFGDPLPGTASEHDIEGCQFAPGPSRELLNGAAQVDTDGTVYAPPDADVLASDRVRVRGDVYEVVGQPQRWGSFGTVILLKRVTG